MPAGFQVIGSHGVVQIEDSDVANLSFRQTGVTGGGTTDITIYNVSAPLICLRTLAGTPAAVRGATYWSGHVTYRLIGGAVQWYVFDRPVNAPAPVGLTVYGPDGTVTYSSDQPPMKIMGAANVPDGGMVWDAVWASIAAPYAGVWAGCLLGPRATDYDPEGPPRLEFIEGVLTTSTHVETRRVSVTGGLVYMVLKGGVLLLVDVAGL
jgi:hypothetical protein